MDTPERLRVAAVQWAPSDDVDANRTRAVELVRDAAATGARLIVLPEYSQCFSDDPGTVYPRVAEHLDGPFVTALRDAARRYGVVVIAGLVESAADRIHNTVVAVDGDAVLAAYRKVHLYDAFGMRESDWLVAGSTEQQPVIDVFGHRVGIQTCYDVRFPESSRRLVDAGADVLAIGAEWVRGPQKERHWLTLLAARAIENTVHVVAADHAPPVAAGCSSILDPSGLTLASIGEEEGIVVADIDHARTERVRATNPSLANRRYRVHPA